MYFGLCNLLEMFQKMMNSIFQELLYEGVLANYMDNFGNSSKVNEETRRTDNLIFEDSRKTKLVF